MLTLSWVLMPRQQLWKPFIVVASYVFYAAANPRFCLLLGGITLISQIAAQMLARTEDETKRKWITGVAVGLDLATLGVFKYYSFFVQDISDLLDTMHLTTPLPLLTVALPIGISFFTFQAITYVVDVKRRQVEPASTIDAAIYLSFFPHLVAGPIVRASEFLPQLREPRDPEQGRGRRRSLPGGPGNDQEGDDRRLPGPDDRRSRPSGCHRPTRGLTC